MTKMTRHAVVQLEELFEYYLEKEKYEAYTSLRISVQNARDRIEADPGRGKPYPSNYAKMVRWRFLWLNEGSYWFGWTNARGAPVITNVFYETARMWRRVKPDDGESIDF